MDSRITIDAQGHATTYSGRDAMRLVQAISLKSALGMLKVGMQPTRGFGMKRALEMATQYTGKNYKLSKKNLDIAIAAYCITCFVLGTLIAKVVL